ncbi:MAG: hypothetical protein K2N65_01420, partial [Anaeroplasmataceae bacterium]|nr:hypothetical protein [Anaeroplasmataceae bacterium]
MSKIGSVGFVQQALIKNQFKIKKKFGQNFLTDSSILNNIVEAAGVTKQDA